MGLPRSGGSGNNNIISSDNNTNNNNNDTTINNNNKSSIGNSKSSSERSSGVPRGEKRAWEEEEDGANPNEPPSKLVCTSPPHALCAEDVSQLTPHVPCLKEASGSATAAAMSTVTSEVEHGHLLPVEATCGVSDESDLEEEVDNEDDRDFLDEEDKDSGFIDSNSIDNSSDDEMDVRLTAGSAPVLTNTIFSEVCLDANNTSLTGETPVTVTSTLDKLSLSSNLLPEDNFSGTSTSANLSPPLDTYNCSGSCPVVPSSTSLPSCSSAFSTYSPLSPMPQFVSPNSLPNMEAAFVPTSFNQSSFTSSVFSSCSDSMDVSNDELPSQVELASPQSSEFNSAINNPSSLVALSDALSTSIALSVDILSNSNSLSYMNQPLSPSLVEEVPACSSGAMASGLMCGYGPTSTDASNMVSVNSNTTVTSAYSGSVSTPAYDPHLYQSYAQEFQPRQQLQPPPPGTNLVNGTWSCNFYDANQSTGMTNKYMEIQTSKMGGGASTSHAIQCDANGKSYMDLGSSSPYTQTYSNECGNYTTSPSNNYSYNTQQNFTNSSYNQPSQQQQPPQFYRPNYPHYNYPAGENYPSGYEANGGCAYGYPPNYSRSGKILPPRCSSPFCDPSKSSIRSPCYQHQRLSVLNMSMCKLNRFSKFSDPSLHKSVLICNTLRLIEKELESEGTSMNALLSQQHMMQTSLPPHCPAPPPTPPPLAMGSSEGPLPPMHPPMINSPLSGPCTPPPVLPPAIVPPYNGSLQYRGLQYPDGSYEDLRVYPTAMDSDPGSCGPELHNLRVQQNGSPLPSQAITGMGSMSPVTSSNSSNSGPAPSTFSSNNTSSNTSNTSSSISSNEERPESGINWCSVLSLPSQSDLDSLNNTEYCGWGTDSNMELEYSSGSSSSTSSSTISNSSSHNSSDSSSKCSTITEVNSSPQCQLPSLSADDVLKSFPEPNRRVEPAEDLDNLINVLVES